jgi:hypothetical protein
MNGVGLDSYGDFYRSYRDLESIQRTGPERYANAAHNIYIDLAANGGLLLILTYVVLNLMVLRIAILSFRKGKLEGLSLVLFAVWVAFIVQSLVSIGQLGVSVWGWVIAGTLIGSLKANLEEVAVHNRPRKKDKFQSEITSPLTVLAMFLSASVGLILAWPPFMADAKFREALESGNNQVIASRSISLGATSWHGDVALDILVKKGDQELALNQSKYLIQANPRDLFAIRTRMVLRGVSKSERFELFKLAKLIDPLNPEIRLPRESSISGG